MLAAVYGARVLRAVWAGDLDDDARRVATEPGEAASLDRVTGVEWLAIGVLTLATIALGLAPHPLMHLMGDELVTLLGGVK